MHQKLSHQNQCVHRYTATSYWMKPPMEIFIYILYCYPRQPRQHTYYISDKLLLSKRYCHYQQWRYHCHHAMTLRYHHRSSSSNNELLPTYFYQPTRSLTITVPPNNHWKCIAMNGMVLVLSCDVAMLWRMMDGYEKMDILRSSARTSLSGTRP